MRRQSKKTKAINDAIAPDRRDYLDKHPCVICVAFNGVCDWKSTDVHEIRGGANRQTTKLDIAYWLAVCRKGHEIVQDMSKEKQFALKVLFDSGNFQVASLCDIKPYTDGHAVLSWIAAYRRGGWKL